MAAEGGRHGSLRIMSTPRSCASRVCRAPRFTEIQCSRIDGRVGSTLLACILWRSCRVSAACACSGSCFSGDTLVRIKESANPVAIRDLKTGQHVQCLDTNEDMRVPTTVQFCEVKNWGELNGFTKQYRRRLSLKTAFISVKPLEHSMTCAVWAVTCHHRLWPCPPIRGPALPT